MMERLKRMKEQLISCVEKELYNPTEANTKELGEAIDMIKDIEEAIYYCTITEAMKGEGKKSSHYGNKYYGGEDCWPMLYYCPDPNAHMPKEPYDPYRDIDRQQGRMYYSGNGTPGMHPMRQSDNSMDTPMPAEKDGTREGRSHMSRKGYMEGKEMHYPKDRQMRELEKYMQELTNDIVEMIAGTSAEEKQLMQKKITTLAEKVGQVNV